MNRSSVDLPSALEQFRVIGEKLAGCKPVVFLDYDGTLTPIVERPEWAILDPAMRAAVAHLANLCTVVVISGRDRRDVENLVGLEGLVYAGSHGFDISGPGGRRFEFAEGVQYLPDLDRAEEALCRRLKEIPGVQVERKLFAIAVHFRRTPDEKVAEVEKIVGDVHQDQKGRLRRTGGKKIFELRPAFDWDKGKAVAWLLEQLGLKGPGVLPLYCGDDQTDEDAFRELAERGIGILVREEERPTHARYALENPEEVQLFLERLAGLVEEKN